MDDDVFSVYIACVGKPVDEALRCVLQRGEFAELHDADF